MWAAWRRPVSVSVAVDELCVGQCCAVFRVVRWIGGHILDILAGSKLRDKNEGCSMYGIQEIDAQTLNQWRETGEKVRLIDIRTPPEVAQGVIEGYEFIPMHLIPMTPIELDDDEKLVIYCRSGARSAQVCMFLAQQGVEAYNLRGGIISWASAGLPIASPDSNKMAG